MRILFNLIKSAVVFTIIFSCSNSSDSGQENDLMELNSLKLSIDQLIATGICTTNTDCDYIAFGSKACGGPKSYLAYSTSINVALLQQKVTDYNNLEHAYNLKWGIASDCMFVLPPTSVECLNGICKAVY